MDIRCCDAYGLSETSSVVSCNYVDHIQPGTLGRPVINTEIKISDEDEILVKGPQMVVGYYKNEESTKAAFTQDEFLKTGDMGEFDSEGNLKITGRIKDLIITSGGKKYLSALIVPAFDVLEPWVKENGIETLNRSELLGSEKVKALYESQIKELTKEYGQVEQIKKFALLESEWKQETGELTPTLKVKRRVIVDKYSDVINRMY